MLAVCAARRTRLRSNVMLHANNFFWQGGVPMFMYDMISAYPEFHHVVVYLYDQAHFGGENFQMMDEWRLTHGCEIAKVEMLTPGLLKEINPAIVCLNSIEGKKVLGPPYNWLEEWPVIFFHHAVTNPIFPSGADVFVSKFVKDKFARFLGVMRNVVLCPPVINTAPYSAIPREMHTDCVIGKVCSAWNSKKYPKQLYDVMREIGKEYGSTSFQVVGGGRHNSLRELRVPRLSFIKEMSMPVPDMLAGMDVMLYINDPSMPETWCRTVSEAMASGIPCVVENRGGPAEQIEDDEDGYVCDSTEDFVAKLSKLVRFPRKRHEMGMRAREKAIKLFGYERLRRELDPFIVKGLMGVL